MNTLSEGNAFVCRDLLYSKTDFMLVHFYTHIDNLIESTNELLSSC